jgi:nitrogen fixation-related uncharacterized protein
MFVEYTLKTFCPPLQLAILHFKCKIASCKGVLISIEFYNPNKLKVTFCAQGVLTLLRANVDTLKRLGHEDESKVQAIDKLVELLSHLDENQEAVELQSEAVALSERLYGNEHSDTLLGAVKLADLLWKNEDYDDTTNIADRSLTALAEKSYLEPTKCREASFLAVKLRRYDLAERLLQKLPSDFQPASTQIHFTRVYLLTDRIKDERIA